MTRPERGSPTGPEPGPGGGPEPGNGPKPGNGPEARPNPAPGPEPIVVGDRRIGPGHPIFFIGEIGINHNGSLELARQIIEMAAFCGVDAVKFQKRTPELSVPEQVKDRIRETPWGEMTYLEYKRRIEFGRDEYDEIDRLCREKGLLWTASPWDLPSLEFIEGYNVPFHKVPSALLTHRELLERLAGLGKPVFLSTGMSTQEEVARAMEVLDGCPVVLLHCNSSYPALDSELNLDYILRLRELYPDNLVGYSGHEQGISPSLVAATLGAMVIERHITTDRALWGTDQGASIDFSGLRRLVRDLKKLPLWRGDGVKRVYGSEALVRDKLRNTDTL